MQKLGQKRKLKDKIYESTVGGGKDLGKKVVDKIFGRESAFSKFLELIKEVDDEARQYGTGEKSAAGPSGSVGSFVREPKLSIKENVKQAKNNFNRKEYLTTVTHLSAFHDQVLAIAATFQRLTDEVHVSQKEFLFSGLPQEHVERLVGKHQRLASTQSNTLVKKAGFTDWLRTNFTQRGRALSFWEKSFPDKLKTFKAGTEKILQDSEDLNLFMRSMFATLSEARAKRDFALYYSTIQKFSAKSKAYDQAFRAYWKTLVSPLLEGLQAAEQKMEEAPKTEKTPQTLEKLPESNIENLKTEIDPSGEHEAEGKFKGHAEEPKVRIAQLEDLIKKFDKLAKKK